MIEHVIPIHISKEGKHYVLSDIDGNTVKVTSPESLFDFLLLNIENSTACKIVYNLYELFSILEQQLPTTLKDELIKNDRCFYGDYKIFSSSGKVLSIGYTKHLHDNFYAPRVEVNVYGIRQYFPNTKVATLNQLSDKTYELMATLGKLGWKTNTLSSAIAIYKDAILRNEFIPSVYDMEDSPEVDGMLDYAYKMMCREFRAVFKVGNFVGATDVDIRSGYPSFIRNFGNTSECKIVHSKKLIKSDFGICKGIVHINKDSPIINAYGQNVVGSYPDYLTTEQWAYLAHYSVGSFDMEDGYFLTFNDPDDKPFEILMDNLFDMREFGGLLKTLAKNISVGFYGYQSQEYPERYGDYFNPIYSVMTTSRCALHMGKLIEEKHLWNDLISVTVDGLLSTKDIELDTTQRIGGWKKEKVDALVLSIGHQYITNHVDENKKDSFQNTYDMMIQEIENHPNKQTFNGVFLCRGLMQTNRNFKTYAKNGRDLLNKVYTSEPLAV